MRVLVCILASVWAQAMVAQSAPDALAGQRALIAAGSLEQAEASLHAYLKDNPASADAHFLLGYVFFRAQKAKESLAEFTKGAQVRRPTSGELETVASDYVLLGDFSDADKWFSEVTVEVPGNARAWYLLGRTKYNEELYEQAISSFERSLSLHPLDVEAENNLGLSLRGVNKLELAKAAFQNAIDWQGMPASDAQPFLNLGVLLADQGESDKAISMLAKAVALAPENPEAHEQLGAAYLKKDDLSKARSEMETAVKLSPETSALHYVLGTIYRKQKLADLAQREFDICTKLNSTHSSNITPNPFQPTPSMPR